MEMKLSSLEPFVGDSYIGGYLPASSRASTSKPFAVLMAAINSAITS